MSEMSKELKRINDLETQSESILFQIESLRHLVESQTKVLKSAGLGLNERDKQMNRVLKAHKYNKEVRSIHEEILQAESFARVWKIFGFVFTFKKGKK